MPERKTPFGLSRGLELDKVHNSFQVLGFLFLFVTWKGCSVMDAVLMEDLRKAYPLKVIEYFQSLERRAHK